jgi:hypothetical protein
MRWPLFGGNRASFKDFYYNDIGRGKLLLQYPPFRALYRFTLPNTTESCQLGDQWLTKPLCTEESMKSGGSCVVDNQSDYPEEAFSTEQVYEFLSITKLFLDHRFIPAELSEQLQPG